MCFVFLSGRLVAQADTTSINYTFATSSSPDGKTIYVSTVFCWTCSSGHPCNGVVYGNNSNSPCDFLQNWALSVFKKNIKGFNGINTTVACVAESLTMYDYKSKENISKKRNEKIANYKKLHKNIILVALPDCKS